MPTLILTPRFTPDAQALWRAAQQLGWRVERLRGWRVPPELAAAPEPVLYLEALLAPHLAEQSGLTLYEPPEDWLPRLPDEYRRREVRLTTLADARTLMRPAFVKPPNDKSFPAKVYATGAELPEGYDGDAAVLVGEIVAWDVEFRCFALDREVRTHSVYLRDGELQRDAEFAATDEELVAARDFAQGVLSDPRVEFGRTAVLDVGVIAGRGWAVVEQNAAWGAGIYGCDPAEVLGVLRWAAERLESPSGGRQPSVSTSCE